MKGPLAGIRICDMTRVLAGPYCTMVLADMGAEVIKIEKPGSGDDTRKWGPPFINGHSYYFLSINRNKKSLAVDVATKSGRKIIYELSKKSDVFIENFVPEKLDSMSLGYNAISKVNPQIIYCSLTGYGSRGPDKLLPGYDLMASAIGGGMHITGRKDGRPMRHGVATTDILTGLYAHSAIIAALYERTLSGKGKKIDCSLLQSQIASMHSHASSYLNANQSTTRMGTEHPNISPYQAFDAKDGCFVIAAANDKHFRSLCHTLELSDIAMDGRFITNPKRVENRDILTNIIQEKISEHSMDYWIHRLEENGVPCGPVNDIGQTYEQPMVKNRIQEFDDPIYGHLRLPGPAVDFEYEDFGEGTSIPSPPPLLGEHTRKVLQDVLNFDAPQIQDLLDRKVIQAPT
ncbi:succinate--hydroxymethylglutarate CoA-transferase-like [Clytia hemisphaerica]|uniref:CoA transferase n=1 Tax=Clytia hemisphaerica TaxID=252671 RepID=A0A7M5X4V7_9CNID